MDPIPLLDPKPGLLENQVAAGLGASGGDDVLVIFGVGIDVSMAEAAAGLTQHHDVNKALFVVPPRDHHRRLDLLARILVADAEVITLVPEWTD